MSRKGKRNTPAVPTRTVPDIVQKRLALKESAEELIREAPELTEDEQQEAGKAGENDTSLKLEDLVPKTAQAHAAYGAAKLRYEKLEAGLELLSQTLGEREQRAGERERILSESDRTLKDREATVRAEETHLGEREAEVTRREQDAELGFLEVRRRTQARHDQQFGVLKEALDERETLIHRREVALERELAERQAALEDRYAERRTELTARLNEKETELTVLTDTLDEREKDLVRRQRRTKDDEEDLKEERKLLEARAERKAIAKMALLQADQETLQERVQALMEDRGRLEEQLNLANTELRKFSGGSNPQGVLLELQRLRNDNGRLQQELDNRPGLDVLQQLNELLGERDELSRREAQLIEKFNTYETRLRLANIQVTELESLKTERDALRTSRDLLTAKLTELREEVDKYTARHDDKSTFPACRDMDRNSELRAEADVDGRLGDLDEFTLDLQSRIASDDRQPLQYRLEDLRAFLGGLAASKLHILQGISGTGKTSLPRAFARAVGGAASIVEVQAGWRDRSDLIGHYNAFERTFYESEFLKALYHARTPQYRDRPFFIVLDEMNLSHPEQYFADFLSMLEPAGERRLRLTTASSQNRPEGILADEKGGDYLPLPGNVWFIGTANQDETTKGFADKTYDRAHVMELPRNRADVQARPSASRRPLSLAAFEQSFQRARDAHVDEAQRAYVHFTDTFETKLLSKFNLGWGNRFERQWLDYVPVILAAGGTVGEAADHLLATKLLRKLRNRFDVQPEDLKELASLVELAFPKHPPVQSLRTLALALRDHGETDDALEAMYA